VRYRSLCAVFTGSRLSRSTKVFTQFEFSRPSGQTSQPAPSAGNYILRAGNSHKSISAISRTFQPGKNGSFAVHKARYRMLCAVFTGSHLGRSTKVFTKFEFSCPSGQRSQPAPSAGNDILTAGNSHKSTSAISRLFQQGKNGIHLKQKTMQNGL
jgi:predicted metal-dependent enzyme (double-stranded beta helix superfamily)